MKRWISMVLILTMLIGMLPMQAFAQELPENTEATQPVESTPTESTPTESTPKESTPKESTPTESTPTESTPTESTPKESTPTESTPTESTPAESTPTESTPTESTPTESTPKESTPAESTPTESEPEEEKPFSQDTTIDGTTVAVKAQAGVFPENAQLQVQKAEADRIHRILSALIPDMETYAAFDLSVTADGSSVQPEGDVSVTLNLGSFLTEAAQKIVSVYYVNPENSTAQKLNAQVDAAEGTVQFTTDHFSVYAVTISVDPAQEETEKQYTLEEVIALYEALPEAESITAETTEEEKDAVFAKLSEAAAALETLSTEDQDIFYEEHIDLLIKEKLLNEALIADYSKNLVEYDHPYNANSGRNTKITIRDSNNRVTTNAVVTVTRNNQTYEVIKNNSNQYEYTRDSISYFSSYTVTVTLEGHETKTVTVNASSGNATINMEAVDLTPEWMEFKLFYIATGIIPDSYAGSGDTADYGPSGNNTPLAVISVDVKKLTREYTKGENPPVKYQTNSDGNNWQYVPNGPAKDIAAVKRFWAAVTDCMSDDSKLALNETGFANDFYGYVLKQQRSDNSQHCDGILEVTPPVYVIELYHTGKFIGGSVTDGSTTGAARFKTRADVLAQYDEHLTKEHPDVVITWDDSDSLDGTTGSYVIGNTRYHVTINQSNKNAARPVTGSSFPYQDKNGNGTYYVATFNLTVRGTTLEWYTVTYTDGVPEENLFANQVNTNIPLTGAKVPAFVGTPQREGYRFVGWGQEGVHEKLFTNEQLATMDVTSDMIFHAYWEALPTSFTGTLEVVLNGSYNSATQVATGTRVDITDVVGNTAVKLYVKADGTEYIPLNRTAEGVYSAELHNGIYHYYYSVDNGENYIRMDEQEMTINGANRTRYLFCNSVTYKLNGGQAAANFPVVTYFPADTAAMVAEQQPTREGYLFDGWLDDVSNKLYAPGDVLVNAITTPHVLTAQWTKSMDVYVNINIQHNVDNSLNKDTGMHNIDFTLDQREAGADGDYTEIARHSLEWDGKEDTFVSNKYKVKLNGNTMTTYTATMPTVEDVPADMKYTVTTDKSGYRVVGIQQENKNGDLYITLNLIFDPDEFDFTYKVMLDDAAKALPEALKPVAVNVKVTCWSDSTNSWITITQHSNTYDRVELDANGVGVESYPVWTQDSDKTHTYHYRIEVVSFELADGSVLPASDVDSGHVQYQTADERYKANIQVVKGGDPAVDSDTLTGAYYDYVTNAQKGNVTAIVSILVHDVTFKPNGGMLKNSADELTADDLTVYNQIVVPNLAEYTPVREGGYTFLGWYLEENEEMTDKTVTSGADLLHNITLIAKWQAPITIEGDVAIAGTYTHTNADGSTHDHVMYDAGRAKSVKIMLQKLGSTGYWSTIADTTVTITYGADGKAAIGTGEYRFEGIPNDGSQYRIQELAPNYNGRFQNEDDSLTQPENYDSYVDSEEERLANLGTENPDDVATVNVFFDFEPLDFPLEFQVNATAIGEAYRPSHAEVLVTFDIDPSIAASHEWHVISQMVYGDTYEGIATALTDGTGSGSVRVWRSFPDGKTECDYGMRIYQTATNNLWTLYDSDAATFDVTYQAPANYDHLYGQSQMLVATLTPRQYPIVYHLNTSGTVTGMDNAPQNHTWSFDTNLQNVVPQRTGYEFLGWYDNPTFDGEPLTKIDAATAEQTDLYAKWQSVQDRVNLRVTINHTVEDESSGLAGNYDKNLVVQLTRALKGTDNPHEDSPEHAPITYDESYWHTGGDGVKAEQFFAGSVYTGLSAEYTYSLNVTLDGYYIAEKVVTSTTDATGVTTYLVEVTLQFYPELLNLTFGVKMADGVHKSLWPVSAEVKVTCWYDAPSSDIAIDWHAITQHENTTLTVTLDQTKEDGYSTGSYPVWQWYSKDHTPPIPYYYRMEVVSLRLNNGTVLMQNGTGANKDVVYSGGNYRATIETDTNCALPQIPGTTQTTALKGAYGVNATTTSEAAPVSTFPYTQVGQITAVIDVDAYTVTFDPAGGSFSDQTTENKVLENRIAMPSVAGYEPSKVGYQFAGWKWSCGTALNTGDLLSQNVTLTAQWEKDENQTKELKYTVVHKIDGVEQSEDTRVYKQTVWVNAPDTLAVVKDSLAAKNYTGYKHVNTENAPDGNGIANNTTVVLNYTKDESQTKTIFYAVEHKVGDTIMASQNHEAVVWINAEDSLAIVADSLKQNSYEGYKFDSISHNLQTGDKVAHGTIITLTYVKDEEQTKTLSYTVKHVVAGEEKASRTYEKTVWIKDSAYIPIEAGSLEQNTYVGYKFDKMSATNSATAEYGKEVPTGTVITLEYVKDDTQKRTVTYAVQHIVDGQVRDSRSYTKDVWINDPYKIAIVAGSLAQKEYEGYKFERMTPADAEEGDLVDNGTFIQLFYVKDDSQKKEVSYTVNHKIGDEVKETETYTKEVWVNDRDAIQVEAGSLDSLAGQEGFEGYKLDNIDNSALVGDWIPDKTVINLQYVKDASQTKQIFYYVQHKVDGVLQPEHQKHRQETVLVADKVTSITVVAEDLVKNTYKGYKYVGFINGSNAMDPGDAGKLADTPIPSGTTITLIYDVDTDQKQEVSYTVKHSVDGVVRETDTKTYKDYPWVNAPSVITVEAASVDPRQYEGYKYSSMEPAVAAGDTVASGTEITLYYVKDLEKTKTLEYTVKHVVAGQEKASQAYEKTVWVNDSDNIPIEAGSLKQNIYVGYKFDKISATNNATAAYGNEVPTGTVITLEYVKDDTQKRSVSYTVQHIVNDQVRDSQSYTKDVWINDPYKIAIVAGSLAQKDYTGYKFDHMTPAGSEIGAQVDNGTLIKLFYVKDDSQTKEVSYTVNHRAKDPNTGNEILVTKTFKETVWVNDPNVIQVKEGSLASLVGVDDRFRGFKLDHSDNSALVGDWIPDGTEINLVYVVDTSQTETLYYYVEHKVDGVLKDQNYCPTTAYVAENKTYVKVALADVQKNTYKGYKYTGYYYYNPANGDRIDRNGYDVEEIVNRDVPNGAIITLVYEQDRSVTQDVSYTVRHIIWHDENNQEPRKETEFTGTPVWVNDPAVIEVTADSIAPEKYTGYVYRGMYPAVAAKEKIASGTEITLYYVKDLEQTKTLEYTVKHVVAGEEKASQTYKETVWINDSNDISIKAGSLEQNTYVGYKFNKISATNSATPAYGNKVPDKTVITLEYVEDKEQIVPVSYTVQHIVDGQAKDSQSYTTDVWVNDLYEIAVEDGSLAHKDYTGYKFDYMTPADAKEGNPVADGTVIQLFYVKDESKTKVVSYTVNHKIGNDVKETQTYTKTVWVNDPNEIQVEAGSLASMAGQEGFEGYKLESITPTAQEGNWISNGTVIDLIYVVDTTQTQTLYYYVEHKVGGVLKDQAYYPTTVYVADNETHVTVAADTLKKNTYTGYAYMGFINGSNPYDTGEVDSLAGTEVLSGTIITLIYEKDDSWKKSVSYTVKHSVDGVIRTGDTQTYTDQIWVNAPSFITVEEKSIDPKNYEGYVYRSLYPVVSEGESIASGTEITLYYVKDLTQTKDVSYKVQHEVAGTVMSGDTRTYTEKIWVNAEEKITVVGGSLIPNSYLGYKLQSITPDVKEGDAVDKDTVITLKYIKDDAQTKPVSYTVQHIVDGVLQDTDTAVYTGSVWVNAEENIAIEKDSLNPGTYVGYKFTNYSARYSEGDVIPSGTIIKLFYSKDETQTKEVSYTVRHVAGHPRETQTYTQNIWVNAPDQIMIKQGSLAQKSYVGYKFDSINSAATEGSYVTSGTEITLTYIRDDAQQKRLFYKVMHKLDGVEQTEHTTEYPQYVWVNEPDTLAVADGSLDPISFAGYEFTGYENKPAGGIIADKTTVVLNYTKDSFGYEIRYYYDGQLEESATVTGEALYETRINTYSDKAKTGYTLDYVTGLPLIIGTDPEQNVISVYYATDTIGEGPNHTLTDPDKIPDKYQALVTYEVVGGTWDGTDSAPKKAVFTLFALDPVTGSWDKYEEVPVLGDTIPDVTAAKPDANHEDPASWDYLPEADAQAVDGMVYVYRFARKPIEFTFDANGGAWATAVAGYEMDADLESASRFYRFGTEVAQIPTEPVREGYTFAGWYGKGLNNALTLRYWATEDSKEYALETTTVYAKWIETGKTPDEEQTTAKLIVRCQNESGSVLSNTESTVSGTYSVTPLQTITFAEDLYVYKGIQAESPYKQLSGDVNSAVILIILEYTKNTAPVGPDNIPDSYQVTVNFRIAEDSEDMGLLAGETSVTQTHTLVDANGMWVQTGDVTPTEVEVTDNLGYDFVKWTRDASTAQCDPFQTITNVPGNTTIDFYAHFVPDSSVLEYPDAEDIKENEPQDKEVTLQEGQKYVVNPNGGIWRQSTAAQVLSIGENEADKIDLKNDPTREGYVFMGWKRTDGENGIVYIFTAQWAKDEGGHNGEEPDGIPDKYQKKVTFKIKNGVWGTAQTRSILDFLGTSDDIVYYLTLTDENGNWSETGSAYLKPLVPTEMKAKSGYHNGKWDETPPDYVSGTDDVTYTYRFTAKSTTSPKTGDESGIMLWLMAMLAAMAALVTVLILGRKKRK